MKSSIPLPRRRRSRRILGALAAAAALVALADPALAADEQDAPTGSIEMELAGGGVTTASGSLEARFALSGDDDEIVVTRGDALASTDAARAWLDGSGSATTAVDEIAVADDENEVTAKISFAQMPGGVYPLAATWDGAEQRALVYVPDKDQQGLALIVPITAPPIEAGILSSAALDELTRSEEHTSELQSRENLVCRLLLEKKKKTE